MVTKETRRFSLYFQNRFPLLRSTLFCWQQSFFPLFFSFFSRSPQFFQKKLYASFPEKTVGLVAPFPLPRATPFLPIDVWLFLFRVIVPPLFFLSAPESFILLSLLMKFPPFFPTHPTECGSFFCERIYFFRRVIPLCSLPFPLSQARRNFFRFLDFFSNVLSPPPFSSSTVFPRRSIGAPPPPSPPPSPLVFCSFLSFGTGAPCSACFVVWS